MRDIHESPKRDREIIRDIERKSPKKYRSRRESPDKKSEQLPS